MSAAPTDRSTSTRPVGIGGPAPEQLWDLHGASLYAMACMLLGDETAALRAVTLGMVDLYKGEDAAPVGQALRAAAHSVYRRCDQMSREDSVHWLMTTPPVMAWLGELADQQRRTLALCVFGGHTYRETAAVLDIPIHTVTRLLNAGLGDLTQSASVRTEDAPSDSSSKVFDLVERMKTRAAVHEGARGAHLRAID